MTKCQHFVDNQKRNCGLGMLIHSRGLKTRRHDSGARILESCTQSSVHRWGSITQSEAFLGMQNFRLHLSPTEPESPFHQTPQVICMHTHVPRRPVLEHQTLLFLLVFRGDMKVGSKLFTKYILKTLLF